MKILINNTPIKNKDTCECIELESLSLDEVGLGKFLLNACKDFIKDCPNWVPNTLTNNTEIAKLDIENRAKWLLGMCIAEQDFGDIIKILSVDKNEEG